MDGPTAGVAYKQILLLRRDRIRADEARQIIKQWEKQIGFETEETEYKALYQRDINAYLAIKTDNTTKGKNTFANPWAGGSKEAIFRFHANPKTTICIEAAIAHITTNADIETFIRASQDITKFVAVRKVEGGATKNGEHVGSVIRWYYRTSDFTPINYATNGNKVPDTDGAWPIMELNGMPADIDYDFYVRKTIDILEEMSYIQKKSKKMTFFD